MRRLAVTFLGLWLGCDGSMIGVQEESTEEAIIGGTVNNGDPAVGFMQAVDGNTGWICTASLISPTVLLTAAHCVNDRRPSTKFYATFVTDASKATSADWLPVSAVHQHPSFNMARFYDGYDIAVLVLQKPAPRTPIAYNTTAMTQSLVGKAVRLVGYGNNNGTRGTGAGIKRQATSRLAGFNALQIQVGEPGKTTCQGDSGGPAFMTINGTETIVGVTSYGPQGCTGTATSTRVDAFASWLAQYVGSSAPPSQPTPSEPTPSEPTPSEPPAACSAESERNDSPATADALCENGRIAGRISSSSDVDWFTWTIPASTYDVTLGNLPASYVMTLYKDGGDGYLYRVATSTLDGLRPQTISRYTTTGGTYYLKVSGVNGASAQASYTVSVQLR